jgi:hypothetical protein
MSFTKRRLEELEEKASDDFLEWISRWGEDKIPPKDLNELIVYLELFQREVIIFCDKDNSFNNLISITFSNKIDIFSKILNKEKTWKDGAKYSDEILDFLDIRNRVYDYEIDKIIDDLINFCVEEDDGYYQHFEYHFYILMLVISGYSTKFPWLIKPGDISDKVLVKDMFWSNFLKLCLKSSDLEKLRSDLDRWGEPIDSMVSFVQVLKIGNCSNIKKYLAEMNFYEVMILYFMNIIELEDLDWAFKNIYNDARERGYQTNLYANSILSIITQISTWKKNSPHHFIDGFTTPLEESRFIWLHEQILTVEDSYKNWSKIAIPEFKINIMKEFAKAIDILCPFDKEAKELLAVSILLQVS